MASLVQKFKYPRGIFSWFGYVLPLQKRLELIKEAGFDATTLWWEDEETLGGLEKNDMPDLVRKGGLVLENIHVPYDHCNDLWSGSALDRTDIVNKHIAWLQDCARHNIPMMVIHVTDGQNPPGPNRFGINSLLQILEIAEEFDVAVAVENTGSAAHLHSLFSEVESESLGFCYDTSHDWLYGVEKGESLQKFGRRLMATHLSDNDGRNDRHWLPGEGIVDWNRVAGVFPGSTYPGALTLEVVRKESSEPPEAFLARAYEKVAWVAGLIMPQGAP